MNNEVDYQKLCERLLDVVSRVSTELVVVENETKESLEEAGVCEPDLTRQITLLLEKKMEMLRYPWELKEKADYRSMYLLLFNAVTYALEQLERGCYARVREILQNGWSSAEEIYISTGED